MAATLTISPSTVTPGATFTASGTAQRKGGASASCRILVENVVKSTFSVGQSGKYSRQITAPTGADRTVQVLLQQLQGTGQWATTAPARTLTIQASQPAPQPTIPTVPLSFSGVAGNTTATLSWSAPSSNGGSALTGYIVYKNGAELTTTAAGTTTYTAGGLVNNTDYQFSAAAKNAVGTGPQTSPPITVRPVAPGDTTAPVVSNLAHSSVTQTGAIISWSLNEPATGRVRYGLSPTALDLLTDPETGFLLGHIQTVSGLTANWPYYYQVFGADAAGNPYASAVQSFTTAAVPAPPPPPTIAYPPDRTLSYVPVPALARPGYLVAISEPTWGTQIKRISNTNMWRNAYATTQPWSKNDRYAYLGYGRRLLDGSTYADLGTRTGLELWLWSHTNEDVAYGIGTGPGGFNTAFLRHNVVANTFTVIRNFNATYADQSFAYNFLDPGGYDTNIALDDHRVALIGRRTSGGTWDIIVFDPIDNQIDAVYNVGSTQPLMSKMAWSGQYVIAVTTGGTKAYTISGGTLVVHRSLNSGTPHQDVARNAALEDVWISTVAPISSIRLSDGLVTNLGVGTTSGPPDIPSFSYGHVSGQCVDWPGWLVASGGIHYGNTTLKGTDQLVALKLDGSGTVKIFGFTRALMSTVDYDYNRVPFAVPNPAGTRVMFGSDWQGSEIFGYVAGMAV